MPEMQRFSKEIWLSKWHTAISVFDLRKSISIKEEDWSRVKKLVGWLRVEETESESVSSARRSECYVGPYATGKGTRREERDHTTTRCLRCWHNILWTHVGGVCLSSTTSWEKYLVDGCGERNHGTLPLWKENPRGTGMDVSGGGCWWETRHAQGIWGYTDTGMPIPSDEDRDEVSNEKTGNTWGPIAPRDHAPTHSLYSKRVYETPSWLEEKVSVHTHW